MIKTESCCKLVENGSHRARAAVLPELENRSSLKEEQGMKIKAFFYFWLALARGYFKTSLWLAKWQRRVTQREHYSYQLTFSNWSVLNVTDRGFIPSPSTFLFLKDPPPPKIFCGLFTRRMCEINSTDCETFHLACQTLTLTQHVCWRYESHVHCLPPRFYEHFTFYKTTLIRGKKQRSS